MKLLPSRSSRPALWGVLVTLLALAAAAPEVSAAGVGGDVTTTVLPPTLPDDATTLAAPVAPEDAMPLDAKVLEAGPETCSGDHALLNRFGWADYSVLATMLIVSVGIGMFYACFGSDQKTSEDFLLGGSSMGTFPMAMSLAAR